MSLSHFVRHTSLRSLIRSGLIFMAVTVAALAGVAVYQSISGRQLARALSSDVALSRAAGVVDMLHDTLRSDALAALLAGPEAPEADKAALRAAVADDAKSLRDTLQRVQALGAGQLSSINAGVFAKAQAYGETAAHLVDLALTDRDAAQAQRPAFDAAFDALEGELEAVSAAVEALADQRSAHVERRFAALTLAIGVAVLLSLLAIAVLSKAIAILLHGLRGALQVARPVADGDLGTLSPAVGSNESARLMQALGDMNKSLRQVVQAVRGGSEQVASASAQIAQGNGDLSQRTERQAAALQQTASTMEQLGGTVRQTADNAHQADALARNAAQVAHAGGEAVGEVVRTMQGIHDSSRRIADIIGVIDGIAFQTNILALNAAVEAARAGDQGRGFAVVAAEVRSLAQRSAGAAREIKNLITASVEQVETGTALVSRAGGTMAEIQASIERVTGIVGEISHASAEQRDGVGQSSAAVSDIDRTTQENAALVEQSAAAAASLSAQANALVRTVAGFRL